ncbi:MAG TPA: DUF4390 domain-containing protein [Rhodocyclaceae bacterium]
MDSSTPCWKSALLKPALAALLALWLGLASAASIETRQASLLNTEDGYSLSADFTIDLGHRVEDALQHGIALYFNLEFELTHSRWYWVNEPVVNRTITYRLSYTPLTRQYRLSTGALHRGFESLDEALRALGHIGSLPVIERSLLKPGESYQAALRLSLDRNQLPRPFQLDLANRDWDVTAKVYRWQPALQAGQEAR